MNSDSAVGDGRHSAVSRLPHNSRRYEKPNAAAVEPHYNMRKTFGMEAVILVGGNGSRLGLLTQDVPKTLLPVAGRPLLHILLGQLATAGFRRVVLCSHYQADLVASSTGDGSNFGIEVVHSVEEAPLGTAGPLSLIDPPSATFLVLNGDLLTELDFGRVIDDHRHSQASATVVVRRQRIASSYGVIETSGERVIDFKEKPVRSELINCGVYALDPDVLDHLEPGRPASMPTLLKRLIDRGLTVRCHRFDRGLWFDVGRPEQLEAAEKAITASPDRFAGDPSIDESSTEPDLVLAEPRLGAAERSAVLDVLDSGWLSMAEQTRAFECELAAELGAPAAVAVSSGTAALHLAFLAADLGPGEEVVLPSLSFVAAAEAVVHCGARPVFADVCSDYDLCIDPADVSRRIGPKTRALVAMHYAGFPAPLAELRDLADRHGLLLIEDAAHAPIVDTPLGRVGTCGDLGCFSFYANKNLTMGEGGAVVGREDLLERVRHLRSHAISRVGYNSTYFDYDVIGFGLNYRPTEMACAIGRCQLRRWREDRRQRQAIVEFYRCSLEGVRNFSLPFANRAGDSAHHLFVILLEAGLDRNLVRDALRERGIQTSVHYPPNHLLRAYRHFCSGSLPVTENVGPRLLSLPLHCGLGRSDVSRIVESLRYAMSHARPELTVARRRS